ncbi:MAG: sulfite exporter TauE/SafE family protein [Nitrospirae bacterium]|nr:MAG: sulfite exporter TauE/SafE family protein [Nitrospirota bacterium]
MFLTGLSGGFGHCLGMCGPLVAAYSLKLGRASMFSHLLYNSGRIFTYMFLGGVVGLVGSFVRVVSDIEPLQRAIMVFAGLLIILMGLSMAGLFRSLINRLEGNLIGGVVKRFSGFINSSLSAGMLFPLGLVMGFIPCGLVYTALVVVARAAMEEGSHTVALLKGGLMMGLFGAGTFPSLVVFAKVVGFIGQRARANIYRVSSLLLIFMGVYFVYRALG